MGIILKIIKMIPIPTLLTLLKRFGFPILVSLLFAWGYNKLFPTKPIIQEKIVEVQKVNTVVEERVVEVFKTDGSKVVTTDRILKQTQENIKSKETKPVFNNKKIYGVGLLSSLDGQSQALTGSIRVFETKAYDIKLKGIITHDRVVGSDFMVGIEVGF